MIMMSGLLRTRKWSSMLRRYILNGMDVEWMFGMMYREFSVTEI
jgi:hypothetical protein